MPLTNPPKLVYLEVPGTIALTSICLNILFSDYEAIRLYNVTGEIRNEVPCKGEHCNEVGDGTIPEELLTPCKFLTESV